MSTGEMTAYIISGDVDISSINVTHTHQSEMLDVGVIYGTLAII